VNKWLNFGGHLDHRLDTGIVFRICHCCEIWKVVSTDCAARRCSVRHAVGGIFVATMTSLRHDRQPRQTCAGGGMHCPSASSYCCKR